MNNEEFSCDRVEFAGPDGDGFVSCRFHAFDTVASLRASCSSDDVSLPQVFDVLEGTVELCRRFERLFSRTIKGSDVWNLNASSGELVEVHEDTWTALQDGKRFSAESRGTFDFTMGAVTSLWNFHTGRVPSDDELAEALSHVGWDSVDLFAVGEGEQRRWFARKTHPQVCVDLGGTAKGLIADRVCLFLREAGIKHAFVNLGGNVAVYGGKPLGEPWHIGVRDPFGKAEPITAVALRSGSVVTSGSSERSFIHQGILCHHILDVATGMPVESDLASVSLVAPTSTEADGRSTMLFSLGYDEACQYVEEKASLEAIFVMKDGEVRVTSGLA